jgi:hypothetical protein
MDQLFGFVLYITSETTTEYLRMRSCDFGSAGVFAWQAHLLSAFIRGRLFKAEILVGQKRNALPPAS